MASRQIVTPVFRMSYCNLLSPRKNEQSGSWSYQITMIFDEDADLSELIQICKEAKDERWGDNPPAYVKSPLRKGSQKSEQNPRGFDLNKNPEYEGKTIVHAASYVKQMPDGSFDPKGKPGLIGPDPNNPFDVTQEKIYSGMYARAQVSAYVPKRKGIDPVVSLGLHNVQKCMDGDPLGGAGNADPSSVFQAFAQPAAAGNHGDLLGGI